MKLLRTISILFLLFNGIFGLAYLAISKAIATPTPSAYIMHGSDSILTATSATHVIEQSAAHPDPSTNVWIYLISSVTSIVIALITHRQQKRAARRAYSTDLKKRLIKQN